MIFIHIEDPALERINEPYSGINPAIGGIQFLAWELFSKLTVIMPDKLRLISTHLHPNLKKLYKDKYCTVREVSFQERDLLIASTLEVDYLLKQTDCKNIVVWSHHPYDAIPQHPSIKTIVTSGKWQSNSVNERNQSYIQNLVPTINLSIQREAVDLKKLKFVYIGSISPAKGLLKIVQNLQKVEMDFPASEFHIIGSDGLYSGNNNNRPGSETKYQEKVNIALSKLKYIQIVLHGLVGDQKFEILQKCDVALLNPTGKSEAFPSSVIECMASGLPVIASNKYGMYDTMKYFPETSIHLKNSFNTILKNIVRNPNKFKYLQLRARMVYEKYLSQNKFVISQWVYLCDDISNGKTIQLGASNEGFFKIKMYILILKSRLIRCIKAWWS